MREYAVITRPFYREHSPSLRKISANNEEEAMNRAFTHHRVKEILDVKLYDEISWDEDTIEEYWSMYRGD